MRYRFKYQITASDILKISMHSIYSSMIGVSNIIFTIAMSLLAVKLWGEVSIFVKMLLILGVCLFPVIQPIAIYIRAKRQVDAVPNDLEIAFDDSGMNIKSKKHSSKLKWNEIKRITKRPNMIIIYTKSGHGYLFPNKVLGEEKEEFYRFIVSKINMS